MLRMQTKSNARDARYCNVRWLLHRGIGTLCGLVFLACAAAQAQTPPAGAAHSATLAWIVPSEVDSFWTHLELAIAILTPIGAGLWKFFSALNRHQEQDALNFGEIKGTLQAMDVKLDTMWQDWKSSDRGKNT